MTSDKNIGDILTSAFRQNRASHAYIVVGEREQLPLLLKQCAKICMCQTHTATDGCENCRKTELDNHQDVLWFPRESRTRLNVADMLFLVDESFKRPIDDGDRRVFLINAVNSVYGIGSDIWQNKLLKTLEEPPENIFVFIGVADAEGLLPTIRSRCQLLRQSRFSFEEIGKILQQNGFEKKLCEIAASVCNGSLENAEAIFANPAILRAYDNASNMLCNLASTKNSVAFVQPVLSERDTVTWFLTFLTLLLRESVVYRLREELCRLPLHTEETEKICRNYSLQAAEVCLEKINLAKKRIDEGGNVNVVVDNLVTTMLEVKYRCRI